MSGAAKTTNDREEAVRWDVTEGELQISCERDGDIWIASTTEEGHAWLRVTPAQARGVAALLNRFADIADVRRVRRNQRQRRGRV